MEYGFNNLGFDKIVSFTSIENIASQRVMQKIRLKFMRYFDHPRVPEGNPLRPHVLYCITKEDYASSLKKNRKKANTVSLT